MAKQIVNIGTVANDGTGDPLRDAFDKINDNFTELYQALGDSSGDLGFSLDSDGNIDITNDLNVSGNLTVSGTTTTISSQTVTFEDNILLINKADQADTPYNTDSAGIEVEKAGTNPSFIHTFSDSLWTLSDAFRVDGGVRIGTATQQSNSAITILKSEDAKIFVGTSETDDSAILDLAHTHANGNSLILRSYGSAETATSMGLSVAKANYIVSNSTTDLMVIGTIGAKPLVLGTNDTERVRITSSGLVGIGETSPDVKFHVKGEGYISHFESTNTSTQLRLTNSTSQQRIVAGDGNLQLIADAASQRSGSYIDFIIDSTSASKMRIDSSGSLGVNITNPNSYSFNGNANIVAGDTSGNGTISIASSTTGIGYLAFADGTSGTTRYRGTVEYYHSTDDMVLKSAAVERMRITSGGNVLFGTNSTSTTHAYFESASNSRMVLSLGTSVTSASTIAAFKNSNGTVGTISVSGSATAYNTSSDYRLKEDLQDFNGSEMLSNIKMYDFSWKADGSRSYGVMAHELQEVLPQAVSGEKDGEEIQSVDYSKIVPVLVKALQEQQAQIDELKARLDG